MAVRLISPRATSPRLSPASSRACLTEPGLISTPRRRPRRRPEAAFVCPLEPGLSRARNFVWHDGQINVEEFELTKRLQNLATARRDVPRGHRGCHGQDRGSRQDGGKKQLAH